MWKVVLAFVVIAFFALWLRWRKSLQSAIPGLPYLPPKFLLGNLNLIGTHGGVVGAFAAALKLGPVAGFWYFGTQWAVIKRFEDAKIVLNSSVFRSPISGLARHSQGALGKKV